jgi:hypothetical protein
MCLSVLAVALLAGCAPTLRVQVLKPGPVNLGAAKKLSVVQTEGRRSAREYVINEVQKQGRSAGYFVVADRTEEGIAVKIAGRSVEVSGGKGNPQAPDEVGLRIDVLDWSSQKDSEEIKNSKGYVTGVKTFYRGKVVLGVTAFNSQGRAVLAEKEYVGNTNGDSEDVAINASATAAVWQLLSDITPQYVSMDIRLDDDDPAQKPIIEMAKGGNLAKALEEERAAVAKSPNSGPANYNLAVLLDAQAQYQEALDAYTKAINLGTKPYYVSMKSECAARLAAAEALQK